MVRYSEHVKEKLAFAGRTTSLCKLPAMVVTRTENLLLRLRGMTSAFHTSCISDLRLQVRIGYREAQNTAFDTTRITNRVDAILSKLRCVEFAKRILTAVRLICSFQ